MVDITHKQNTLRTAIASAIVRVSLPETIERVTSKTVPKGDVFEFARAAGLLGIKRTSDMIPDCHPLPVEYAHISYEVKELEIHISVEVHTLYKTGVEVEAMHGASVVALVIYDMLKPIDPAVEIGSIRLERKTGGKSDRKTAGMALRGAVIVCSDSVSRGVAGFAGRTLVLTLPGSLRGAEETMDAIFPQVLHVFTIRDGARH